MCIPEKQQFVKSLKAFSLAIWLCMTDVPTIYVHQLLHQFQQIFLRKFLQKKLIVLVNNYHLIGK